VKTEKNKNKREILLLGSSHSSEIGPMLQETRELNLTCVVFSDQMLLCKGCSGYR
jgi:hypothetical protein